MDKAVVFSAENGVGARSKLVAISLRSPQTNNLNSVIKDETLGYTFLRIGAFDMEVKQYVKKYIQPLLHACLSLNQVSEQLIDDHDQPHFSVKLTGLNSELQLIQATATSTEPLKLFRDKLKQEMALQQLSVLKAVTESVPSITKRLASDRSQLELFYQHIGADFLQYPGSPCQTITPNLTTYIQQLESEPMVPLEESTFLSLLRDFNQEIEHQNSILQNCKKQLTDVITQLLHTFEIYKSDILPALLQLPSLISSTALLSLETVLLSESDIVKGSLETKQLISQLAHNLEENCTQLQLLKSTPLELIHTPEKLLCWHHLQNSLLEMVPNIENSIKQTIEQYMTAYEQLLPLVAQLKCQLPATEVPIETLLTIQQTLQQPTKIGETTNLSNGKLAFIIRNLHLTNDYLQAILQAMQDEFDALLLLIKEPTAAIDIKALLQNFSQLGQQSLENLAAQLPILAPKLTTMLTGVQADLCQQLRMQIDECIDYTLLTLAIKPQPDSYHYFSPSVLLARKIFLNKQASMIFLHQYFGEQAKELIAQLKAAAPEQLQYMANIINNLIYLNTIAKHIHKEVLPTTDLKNFYKIIIKLSPSTSSLANYTFKEHILFNKNIAILRTQFDKATIASCLPPPQVGKQSITDPQEALRNYLRLDSRIETLEQMDLGELTLPTALMKDIELVRQNYQLSQALTEAEQNAQIPLLTNALSSLMNELSTYVTQQLDRQMIDSQQQYMQRKAIETPYLQAIPKLEGSQETALFKTPLAIKAQIEAIEKERLEDQLMCPSEAHQDPQIIAWQQKIFEYHKNSRALAKFEQLLLEHGDKKLNLSNLLSFFQANHCDPNDYSFDFPFVQQKQLLIEQRQGLLAELNHQIEQQFTPLKQRWQQLKSKLPSELAINEFHIINNAIEQSFCLKDLSVSEHTSKELEQLATEKTDALLKLQQDIDDFIELIKEKLVSRQQIYTSSISLLDTELQPFYTRNHFHSELISALENFISQLSLPPLDASPEDSEQLLDTFEQQQKTIKAVSQFKQRQNDAALLLVDQLLYTLNEALQLLQLPSQEAQAAILKTLHDALLAEKYSFLINDPPVSSSKLIQNCQFNISMHLYAKEPMLLKFSECASPTIWQNFFTWLRHNIFLPLQRFLAKQSNVLAWGASAMEKNLFWATQPLLSEKISTSANAFPSCSIVNTENKHAEDFFSTSAINFRYL